MIFWHFSLCHFNSFHHENIAASMTWEEEKSFLISIFRNWFAKSIKFYVTMETKLSDIFQRANKKKTKMRNKLKKWELKKIRYQEFWYKCKLTFWLTWFYMFFSLDVFFSLAWHFSVFFSCVRMNLTFTNAIRWIWSLKCKYVEFMSSLKSSSVFFLHFLLPTVYDNNFSVLFNDDSIFFISLLKYNKHTETYVS